MLERLGNALYWLSCILAAILIAVSVYVFATNSTGLGIAMSIAYALTAVVVWLLGWMSVMSFRDHRGFRGTRT